MEPLIDFEYENVEVKVKIETQDIDTDDEVDRRQEHGNILEYEPDLEDEKINSECLLNIKLENNIISTNYKVEPNARNINNIDINETKYIVEDWPEMPLPMSVKEQSVGCKNNITNILKHLSKKTVCKTYYDVDLLKRQAKERKREKKRSLFTMYERDRSGGI